MFFPYDLVQRNSRDVSKCQFQKETGLGIHCCLGVMSRNNHFIDVQTEWLFWNNLEYNSYSGIGSIECNLSCHLLARLSGSLIAVKM